MAKTLFDLTLELARIADVVREGVATGGSTTTIVDTVERVEADDTWNLGTAWITYDAAGAGAAPQGEYSVISDFTASSDTVTLRSTLTAAVASGDRYAITLRRYPLDVLIQKINESLPLIEKTDISTITTAANQTEHSLPTDLLELKQVWIQAVDDDANDNRWVFVDPGDWRIQKAATGSANVLIIPQFDAGYDLKLVYTTYHTPLRVSTDKLDDTVTMERVIWNAYVGLLRWRRSREDDASINDLLNFAQAKAAQVNTEQPLRIPKKSAKTINLRF